MKLASLHVQNYRGLRDVEIPLSRFGCLIGKNNAGKSTFLQALSLFFSGTKLNGRDFFDASQPIRIELRLEQIQEEDLVRLALEHREKIAQTISGGNLTLVRVYETDGSSKLMHVTLAPKAERFKDRTITEALKGKKGKELRAAAIELCPELNEELLSGATTQAAIKDAIKAVGARLPNSEKELSDEPLPTGIDASIKAMLPEPIYIPAVKNLADDVKAKESTPFGKILGILLTAIEPQLGNITEMFSELSRHFNRVVQADGHAIDDRLPEVRNIESTVERYLKESFAKVSLEISVPPPELKTILSSAELLIDDGIQGPIESKGDGLRRATVFAILRAFVALNEPGAISGAAATAVKDRHLLLFEEPELYLHPSAQEILFDALRLFADSNHVLITTHSPAFFGPKGTASFVKLVKTSDESISGTPFTVAHPVSLDDLKAKDQFQLICFENNNAAFFFDSVVLVEGDSDYIAIPHIASLITADWDKVGPLHKFVRIHGKGSIRRYREFFSRFKVRVAVVTDLDLITSGFDAIEPSLELRKLRDRLFELVDKEIVSANGFKELTESKAREAQEKTELLGRWKHAKAMWESVQRKETPFEELVSAVDAFFAWEKKAQRLSVLQDHSKREVLEIKRELLAKLREEHVYVLERGALEAYYPEVIQGSDKPTKAQDFCKRVSSKPEVLALCDEHLKKDGTRIGSEFEIICDGLFADSSERRVGIAGAEVPKLIENLRGENRRKRKT